MANYFLSLWLLCTLSSFPAKAASDTVSVYFPFNKSTLTDASRRQLDKMIDSAAVSDKQTLQIIGYADDAGGADYNLRLSKQRAASVKAYLVQSGFRADRIVLIMGKGEAGAHPGTGQEGNPADRRVTIVKVSAPVPPGVAKPLPMTASGQPRKASTTDIRNVAVGETLILDKIFFQPGMNIILRESCDALDALFTALRTAPKVRIRIEGHVCCASLERSAEDADNSMKLSVARARTVYDFLVERGIPAARLEYAGFSNKRPLVTPELNGTDMASNRRVEIRVIE